MFTFSTRRLVLLAVAAGALVPAGARADQLDKKLDAAMPGVVAGLKKKGIKNVGALRFSVKQAGKTANYTSPLSGSLATRIENLLVMHGGPSNNHLDIIHDASKTARAGKVGAWPTSAAERKKLFTLDYPLAYGNKKVKADALLTGKVELSKDMRTATLTVQMIDKKTAAVTDLTTVKAPAGLQLIRDLGYSVALNAAPRKKMIASRSTARDQDKYVTDVIDPTPNNERPKNKPGDKPGDGDEPNDKPGPSDGKKNGEVKSEDVGGVTVEMRVDGSKVDFRPNSAEGETTAWQVTSPAAGKTVTFFLKNNTDKKRAVVIRLNGVNLINSQKAEPESCGKFVLDAGKSVVVKGFLEAEAPEGDEGGKAKIKILPIKVVTGEEAKTARADLGDKAGMIEVDVFEEGAGEVSGDMQITLRGLPRAKERAARKSYDTLRRSLVASAGKKIVVARDPKTAVSRELLVKDDKAPGTDGGDISIVKFKPQFVARIAVKVVPAEATPD